MTTSRIHCLLVSEYGALNGGEHSLLAVLPQLQLAGVLFTALLPARSDFANALASTGVVVEDFRFRHDDGARKSQSLIREQLKSRIEYLCPHIVHANSLAAGRIVGPVTSRCDVPAMGYLRDIIKLSQKAISDLNSLDRLIAVSWATARFHIARGIAESKLSVIYNGVELNRFTPRSNVGVLAVKQATTERKICLCVGQIGMRKGIDLSLKMLSQVAKRVGNLEIHVVGERHSRKQEAVDYENGLREFARQNFEPNFVTWLGRRTDVPELMRHADLLVHGAKQEPLGRVLLEAAASGLPIVTTNVGGTPEILEGLDQYMFDPASFDEAIPVVQTLLTDAEMWRDYSQQLRSVAEKKFSVAECSQKLLRCYQQTIRQHRK